MLKLPFSKKLSNYSPEKFAGTRSKIISAVLLLALSSSLVLAQKSESKLPHESTDAEAKYQPDAALAELLRNYDSLSQDEKKHKVMQFRNSPKASGPTREKSAYILARLMQKGGSPDELKQAVALYDEASRFHLLNSRSDWHYVDCAIAMGNESLVQDKLNEILKSTRDTEQKAHAEYNLAQSLLRSNENEKAVLAFKHIIKEAPSSQFAIGAKYYLGQAAADAKDSKEALKYWREYLSKSADGRFAMDVVKSMKANFADELVAADHSVFADVYYLHGSLTDAIGEWRIVGTDEEWYKQGVSLIKTNKRVDGEDVLTMGIKRHTKAKEIPDAAKLMARIGTKAEAIAIWKVVLENCPDYGDYALFNLGARATDEEALEYYQELISKYPNSEFAPETSWWLVWNKIKEGQLTDAANDLRAYTAKFANARSAARFNFWLGKVEEKLKHAEAAKAAYQTTVSKFGNNYYGYRAKARLAALTGKNDSTWQTDCAKHLNEYNRILKNGSWTHPEPPQAVSYETIARGGTPLLACLTEMHQWDESLELVPKDKLYELKSICYAKQGMMMESINSVAKEIHGTPDSAVKWRLSYPLLHASTIKFEATTKQVDPFLAQGLIREESRYNVRATSSSNAIGLMQLLPGTAMGVAKRLKVTVKSKDDIYKPENNLKFGIDYISYVLSRHSGNAMLAVASYNGGPNAVASWTKRYSMDDPDMFVENIPFTETRDYVRKVFGSYWNYVAIYAFNKSE